ncbi:MAG TPA: hypothetical protein PK082_04940, partial [Phycisphaerae bacterium]|nr:hypothetical protein [Phycisphaerae bacterium]
MKRWALVTIGLYAVVAIPLAALLVLACFVPEIKAGDWSEVYLDIDDGAWITWAFIAFMVLAQALLLVVPVRQAGERPVRRRHVFWTLLAAVLLLVLLAVGMILAVYETIANTR